MPYLTRYQLDVLGLVGGPGIMTFHSDPVASGNTDQQFVDAVQVFLDVIDLYTVTTITYSGYAYVEYFDAATGTVTAQQPVTPASAQGDNSATALPPVTQALIRWATGVWVSGRQLRGHTFLPGMGEDTNESGGTPQTAVMNVIAAAANVLAADAGLVVWSRTHGTFEPVSVATVSNQWAYLSGRRDG